MQAGGIAYHRRVTLASNPWALSWRADPMARRLADRHYNRQHPDSPQFVPPGACVVFVTLDETAVWVTSAPLAEYVRHEWAGAWVNSLFRREGGPHLASDLITAAVAATRWVLGDPPPLGMVTFVDRDKTRRKRDPGRCYRRAGWTVVGETKGGLVALGISPTDMPEAQRPIGASPKYKPAEQIALAI